MFRITSKKQQNDEKPFDIKNIKSKRLDGKEQPINQYSIKYKEGGKKTKVIKAEWQDSITTAHRMLLNVNKELDEILKELNEIYEELTKDKKVSYSNTAVKKVQEVKEAMQSASDEAAGLVKSFKTHLPEKLKGVKEKMSELKAEDWDVIKDSVSKDKYEQIKKNVTRIAHLEQNIVKFEQNIVKDAQDSNQVSRKKKSDSVPKVETKPNKSGEDSDSLISDSTDS